MGRNRVNLNQIKYRLRGAMKWMIPYKYRKPFYLIGGITGLVLWFQFLLRLSSSKYLYALQNIINESISFLWQNYDHRFLATGGVLLIFVICLKYFRIPMKDNENESKEQPHHSNGSIYYQVNGTISMLYIVFLGLALLPLLM